MDNQGKLLEEAIAALTEQVSELTVIVDRLRPKSTAKKLPGVPIADDNPGYLIADRWRASLIKDGLWVERKSTSWSEQRRKWVVELDKMHRIDGLSWNKITELIKFLIHDEFWGKNCQSAMSLRKPSRSDPTLLKWQQIEKGQRKERRPSKAGEEAIAKTQAYLEEPWRKQARAEYEQ